MTSSLEKRIVENDLEMDEVMDDHAASNPINKEKYVNAISLEGLTYIMKGPASVKGNAPNSAATLEIRKKMNAVFQ